MGPWLLELQGHVEAHMAGSNPVKYYHKYVNLVVEHRLGLITTNASFAHDGSIAPLLGALQIDNVRLFLSLPWCPTSLMPFSPCGQVWAPR